MADPIGNICTKDASKYTHTIIREVMFALRSAYRLNDPKPLKGIHRVRSFPSRSSLGY